MLDVVDFVTERGGNPNAVRESQRRRHAPVEAVDEVIALYEDHRKSMFSVYSSHPILIECRAAKYALTQVGTKINANQKEIGQRKKVSRIQYCGHGPPSASAHTGIPPRPRGMRPSWCRRR